MAAQDLRSRPDHGAKSPPHTARRPLCRFTCQFRVRDAEWRMNHLGLVAAMVDELGLVEWIDPMMPQDFNQRTVSIGF